MGGITPGRPNLSRITKVLESRRHPPVILLNRDGLGNLTNTSNDSMAMSTCAAKGGYLPCFRDGPTNRTRQNKVQVRLPASTLWRSPEIQVRGLSHAVSARVHCVAAELRSTHELRPVDERAYMAACVVDTNQSGHEHACSVVKCLIRCASRGGMRRRCARSASSPLLSTPSRDGSLSRINCVWFS